MKKKYLTPKLECERLTSTDMLAVSLEGGGNGDGRPASAKYFGYYSYDDCDFEDDFDNE